MNIHTVAAINLRAGDAHLDSGRIVSSVERNMDNLSAAIIRFADGTWIHVGTFDAIPVRHNN